MSARDRLRGIIRDGDPAGYYAIGARAPRNPFGFEWDAPLTPQPPIIRKREGEFDPTKLDSGPKPPPDRRAAPVPEAAPAEPKRPVGFRFGATPRSRPSAQRRP